MERELLAVLGDQAVDDLLVLAGAERDGAEGLGLAAAGRAPSRACGRRCRPCPSMGRISSGLAAVGADALLDDQAAGELLVEAGERGLRLGPDLRGRGGLLAVVPIGLDREVRVEDLLAEGVDGVVAVFLALDLAGRGHLGAGDARDLRGDLRGRQVQLARDLRLPGLGGELADEGEDVLDVLGAELERGEGGLFADLGGTDLDHVQAVLVAREHHVQVAVLHLRDTVGLITKLRAVVGVDASDADRGGGALEGDVGDGQGGGRGSAREDVGVVLAVVAQDEDLDQDLVEEAIGEERPDRAVDHPHRQDFLLARWALALLESSGELACGGGLLAVVDGEGEEVDAVARVHAPPPRAPWCRRSASRSRRPAWRRRRSRGSGGARRTRARCGSARWWGGGVLP